MSTGLRRYIRSISTNRLSTLLADPSFADSEPIKLTADVSEIRKVAAAASAEGSSKMDLANLDSQLVEPLHRAMPKLPHRLATDMRFWHWLCIAELQDVVWYRWYGSIPSYPGEALTESAALSERFLGSNTLHGVSRNALARLWWCAETLHSESDGYRLARQALAKQDLFQAIFERQFGLYPPAARACLRRFGDDNISESEWREGTRQLNHYLTTIVLEALSEEDILELLSK